MTWFVNFTCNFHSGPVQIEVSILLKQKQISIHQKGVTSSVTLCSIIFRDDAPGVDGELTDDSISF